MNRTIVVILVVLALCAGVSSASGQELQGAGYKHNAIYAELLGQGILYSINYDYLITENLSLRAGFSTWSIPAMFFIDGDLSFTGYPVLVNYLVGNGDSRLEIGAGILPAKLSLTGHDAFFGAELSGDTTIVMGTGSLVYRYQQRDGGLVFRVGLTPFYYSGRATLSGGLSLGIGF
jgi:hypothetical protein